jgi:DNA replication ATP-dependent helicase Dna2
LLKDWRRINVSFTRAKKKLIIIGSKSTLSAEDHLLSKLLAFVQQRDWILDLPKDAEAMHILEATAGDGNERRGKSRRQAGP